MAPTTNSGTTNLEYSRILYCFGFVVSKLVVGSVEYYLLDTFQDFLIAEHMKPRMHILEISISSLNHVFIRPTETPKLADKKCAQFYHLRCFKN